MVKNWISWSPKSPKSPNFDWKLVKNWQRCQIWLNCQKLDQSIAKNGQIPQIWAENWREKMDNVAWSERERAANVIGEMSGKIERTNCQFAGWAGRVVNVIRRTLRRCDVVTNESQLIPSLIQSERSVQLFHLVTLGRICLHFDSLESSIWMNE